MKTVLLAVALGLCACSLHAQANVEITFRVNMNVQIGLGRFSPGIDFPVVRGTLNGWGCTDPMLESDDEDGVYELQVRVANHVIGAGEYKFNINCGQGGVGRWEDAISNRRYTVTGAEPDENDDGFGELVLETVFFDDAVAGADAELFFQVDMNVQIASGRFDPVRDQVVVRGALNGWGCSEALADGDADGIYEIYIRVSGHQVGTGQYKFNINCADSGWEDSISNRRYRFTGNEPDSNRDGYVEVELPLVYFDDIESGPDIEILFRVDMTRPIDEKIFIPESMTVHVGGGFNGWSCSAELEEFDESVYELAVRIPSHPVGVSEYKFNISCEEFSWEPELSNRTYVVTNDLPDEDGDGFLELTPGVAFYNALENPFIDAELVFEVDMSVYEREGLFDPANDTVVVRGEFNGVSTAVPGIRICEHLPRLSQRLDKLCLLRSMTHGMNVHGPAMSQLFTGRDYPFPPITDQSLPGDWPSMSSLAMRFGQPRNGLPPSIVLPWYLQFPGQSRLIAGQTAGRMGRSHDAVLVDGDPNKDNFRVKGFELADDVSIDRLDRRRNLLSQFERSGPIRTDRNIDVASRHRDGGAFSS